MRKYKVFLQFKILLKMVGYKFRYCALIDTLIADVSYLVSILFCTKMVVLATQKRFMIKNLRFTF